MIGDDHGVELPGQGQLGHIHAQIGDVGLRPQSRQAQHGKREINAGDIGPGLGQQPAETAAAAAKLKHGAGNRNPFPVKGEILLEIGHFQVVEPAVAFTAQGQEELIRLLVAVKDVCGHSVQCKSFPCKKAISVSADRGSRSAAVLP